MKLLLNVVGLLIILILDACPNTAFPATPTPPGVYYTSPKITPIPESVLPIDFPGFCAQHRAGAYTGLVSTSRGVYIVCSHGHAWLFTKVGVPPIETTPVPGLNP
jgi:hypothetical protein